MNKKEKYILMNKNKEVLSFFVNLHNSIKFEVIERLGSVDLLPYKMKDSSTNEELSVSLMKFFNGRAIANNRYDYEDILKATNSKNSFELVFKGHGLSLIDHFWFKKENESLKYEDINFFTNKWDDTFGRAVLAHDYETLKKASLEVPDLTTTGWACKGWIYDNGPVLYKLGNSKDRYEEPIVEVLASRLANRIFAPGDVLKYELKEMNGKYISTSRVMIGIDEELVPLASVLPASFNDIYRNIDLDKKELRRFFNIASQSNIPGLKEFFVKLMCLRSLCFTNDLHFNNISMIRNLKTNEMRLAPLYDLASSFGSSANGRAFLSNLNKGSYIIIYFVYGNLDPNWDYSWYDPDKLIGFEDEIREYLSKSDFYTDTLINNIIDVYKVQKRYLDANKK